MNEADLSDLHFSAGLSAKSDRVAMPKNTTRKASIDVDWFMKVCLKRVLIHKNPLLIAFFYRCGWRNIGVWKFMNLNQGPKHDSISIIIQVFMKIGHREAVAFCESMSGFLLT